jgi:hypothetical protein
MEWKAWVEEGKAKRNTIDWVAVRGSRRKRREIGRRKYPRYA